MNSGATRKLAPGAALLTALGALALMGCPSHAREEALKETKAPTPYQRVEAVRALAKMGKPDDDELWVAIERLTRDPSTRVRIAAAESLAGAPKADDREPDQRGALADDALSAELSDLDETVRIAAAQVLGGRCNPRAIAYLHGAYGRSGPAVRAVVAESLERCGVPLEKILNHAEAVLRLHAMEKITSTSSAWRTASTRELGLLGRPDDVAKILPLLDDRDGNVAAAAAEGLGYANAKAAIPALQKASGDPVPLIANAAVDALTSFGVEALSGDEATLAKQAAADGDQAATAAGALSLVAKHELLCPIALKAQVAAAAALLARGCPATPFADALGELMKGAKAPLDEATAKRAEALLEALSQAAQSAAEANLEPPPGAKAWGKMIAIPSISERDALALGALAQLADPPLAARAAEVAQRLDATKAGPALLAIAQREKKSLDAERAAHATTVEDNAAAARELAEAAVRAPAAADRQKVAKLMAMLRARDEKNGRMNRPDAAARLKQLLAGEGPVTSSHPLLSASLRAALALHAKGAAELAAALHDDADPGVASAARGEPIPTEPAAPLLAPECVPVIPKTASNPSAAAESPDAGSDERDDRLPTFSTPAPSRAAKPGCLEAWLSLLPSRKSPPGAVDSARASLWSDDGAERAAACRFLAKAGDSQTAALRADFQHDPERRVRDACTPGETLPPAPR